MINALNIALSGLGAATKKLGVSANNIANLQTSGSIEDGGKKPYTPQKVEQTTGENGGVQARVTERSNAYTPVYSPDSPQADENGIIGVPNVDLAEEGVNTILTKTEYAANLKVIETASKLSEELIRTLDKKA